MRDLTTTPLNEREIAVLAPMGVSFYNDRNDGTTTVLRRYWNGITQDQREALVRAVAGLAAPDAAQKILHQKGQEFACTEAGNAERFISRYGKTVRYIPEEGRWYVWDGSRWKLSQAQIKRKALETTRSIYSEAARCDHDAGRAELSAWARRSESKHNINAMLDLAQMDLTASVTEFDQRSDCINCKNGIVRLKTGELVPHSSDQLVMKQANVSYRVETSCHLWRQFLAEVFEGDAELIDWMQRALGYSLTGSVAEQTIFILYGLGENGKSVLAETMLKLMGSYACTVQFDAFTDKKTKGARDLEATGGLKGNRFALASETSGTQRWDEAFIKRASGGDTLKGGQLYGKSFDFEPTHKLWFLCNRIPTFRDGSHGFKRRIVVIPFNACFSGDKKDKHLPGKLLAEREGIFAWLVEGAKRYHHNGLDDLPAVVREATDEYLREHDTLGAFIDERLRKNPLGRVRRRDVYEAYQRWCLQNDEVPQAEAHFKGNLRERGIQPKDMNTERVYLGVELVRDQRPTSFYDPIRSDRATETSKVRSGMDALLG